MVETLIKVIRAVEGKLAEGYKLHRIEHLKKYLEIYLRKDLTKERGEKSIIINLE